MRWASDHVDFMHNLADVVVRTLGVERNALLIPLMNPAYAFHAEYARGKNLREGTRVSVYVSLYYTDPGQWSSKVSDIVVSLPPQPNAPGQTGDVAQQGDQPPPTDRPQPGETDAQRMVRQAGTTVRILSGLVALADENGWDRATMVVANTGREIEPRLWEQHGPQKARPSGTAPKSASSIAAYHLGPIVGDLVNGQPGEMVIEFQRDDRGIMQLQKWQRRPLPPVTRVEIYKPLTEREMLDKLGIPNPRKIWTEIGQKWEQEVKDAGTMILTFGITEVATWIIGGALLKVLGAGLSKLGHLYRLMKGGKTKAIADGLAKMAKGEAEELAGLLDRVKRGEKLNAGETKQLQELAERLDEAVAPGAKTATQGGGTTTKSPSKSFDEEPTVPGGRSPYAGPPRIMNRSTANHYSVVDSSNPMFSIDGHLGSGGQLSMIFRTEYKGERSTVLFGAEQFRAMLNYFSGRVRSIKGSWSYETNLAKFNELTRQGKSATEAALGTWTGQQASAAGFSRVVVRSLEGTRGSYTKVEVIFHP